MPEPIVPDPGATAADSASTERAGARVQTQAVRLARKTQSLDILYEIATSLSQPGSLDQVLDGFLQAFSELLDAPAASVRLATADGQTRLAASRGLASEAAERELERACAEFVSVPVKYHDRILGVYNLFLDRPLSAMGEDKIGRASCRERV